VSRLSLLNNLRQSIPFLAREKASLPRGEMLALKPVRSRGIAWEMGPEDEPPGAKLTVPRRDDRVGKILSRVFRITATKTIELDEINARLWERCDGQHSVDQLIRYTCETYKMNRRQGEVGVITAMRMFAQRGLIGLSAAKPDSIKNSDRSSGMNGGKGTPNVRSDTWRRPQTKRRRRH